MINLLKENLIQSWPQPLREEALRFTKFCQRVTRPDSKVLFLVTHQKQPLCIIKTMRSKEKNSLLKSEAKAQKTINTHLPNTAPKVFFEGELSNGLYVYAEEVIKSIPVSRREALLSFKELARVISKFPTYGEVSVGEVVRVIEDFCPQYDTKCATLLALLDKSATLKTGFSHSDLGRVNILGKDGAPCIIDWERAGETPFWLIDAVYLFKKLHRITTIEKWRAKSIVFPTEFADEKTLESLFILAELFETLRLRYPGKYAPLTQTMRKQFTS